MVYSTENLVEMSRRYQRMAEQGELSLLSDDSIISLEEIQFTMSVLLDLKVGQIALTTDRFQEYLEDMIDICVTACREDLSQNAARSLVKENYPYELLTSK